MNPTAIYSKTGKGVQEASGKTSNLSRADRAVLSAIDGKSNVGALYNKFEKTPRPRFDQLIERLEREAHADALPEIGVGKRHVLRARVDERDLDSGRRRQLTGVLELARGVVERDGAGPGLGEQDRPLGRAAAELEHSLARGGIGHAGILAEMAPLA